MYQGSFHCIVCGKVLGYSAAMKKAISCKRHKPIVASIQPEIEFPCTVTHIELAPHGTLAILIH